MSFWIYLRNVLKCLGQYWLFLDFVVIVDFDDILYSLQNQGLSVVFNWVLIIILFALPYELVVAQLRSTFDDEQDEGLASWIRHSTIVPMVIF